MPPLSPLDVRARLIFSCIVSAHSRNSATESISIAFSLASPSTLRALPVTSVWNTSSSDGAGSVEQTVTASCGFVER